MITRAMIDFFGLAGAIISIITAIVLVTLFFAKIQAKITESKLKDDNDKLQLKIAEINSRLSVSNDLLSEAKKVGTPILLLKLELDKTLSIAKSFLSATAASILVKNPRSVREELIFLAVDSPNAFSLIKQRIPCGESDKGIAATVFKTGRAYTSVDTNVDKIFNPSIDKRVDFKTENILALPLKIEGKTIGVIEFLNKMSGSFNEDDLRRANNLLKSLSNEVNSFIEKPENFEILGIASEKGLAKGTVLIIDLSNSSSLLELYPVPLAVDLLNEYMDVLGEEGTKYGATIDKFTGDGFILLFNVPKPLNNFEFNAIKTACDLQTKFIEMKNRWVDSGVPAKAIYQRISISTGDLAEVIIGPYQHKEQTVLGMPMMIASNLSLISIRTDNLIVIDNETNEAVKELISSTEFSIPKNSKSHKLTPKAFEVLEIN